MPETLEFPQGNDKRSSLEAEFGNVIERAIADARAARIGRIATLEEAEWWSALREEFLLPALQAARDVLSQRWVGDADELYVSRLNGADLLLRQGSDELRFEKQRGKEFLISTTNPDAQRHAWSAAPDLSRETIADSTGEFLAYLAAQE